MVDILIELRYNLKIDLICISLIARNAEYFAKSFLDICDSLLRTVHFISPFIGWQGMFKIKFYYIN